VAAACAEPDKGRPESKSILKRREAAGGRKRVRNWQVWQKMLLCAVILFVPTALTVLGAVLTVFNLTTGNVGVVLLIAGIVSLVAGGYCTVLIARDISDPLRQLASEARQIADGQKQSLGTEARLDEIGELSEAFRRVVETSRQDRERLQHNNNELQAMNTQLEDANKQVQSFAYKAGEANNAKREFLAVMSHEIRTPVNGIIGMTELALQTDLTPGQREYLETINNCADSLLAQLNDVLDFSKIEAGKLELERTDFSLRELLGEALSTLAPRAHARGLELLLHIRPEVPDTLVGDPHRLRQIVVNLVGNALKFTEKGDVLVRVENSRWVDGDAELAFAIADTGIGIPADRITTIFQPFSQADYSTTRRFGGTGLGLAITQQLVGLMRGAIKVESEVGKGSVFRFTARFGYHKPAGVEVDHTVEGFRGLRVLVLEPHANSLRITKELLTAWHAKADQARDAVTALHQLRAAAAEGKPFDLLIVDASRSESTGVKLASTIGSYSELASTRIILLISAQHRNETERFGTSIRATIVKPVTVRSLRAAMAKALETGNVPAVMTVPKSGGVPAQRQLKVLVAEDNAVNQRLAKLNLEGWGHVVTVANDGQDAVDAFEKYHFDLILMDLQMPRLSGFEASAEIRKREQPLGRPRTPILALSANVLKGVRDECAKNGMDGYVSKPVRQQELVGAMSQVIPGLFVDPAAAAAFLENADLKPVQPANASAALFTAPPRVVPLFTTSREIPAAETVAELAEISDQLRILESPMTAIPQEAPGPEKPSAEPFGLRPEAAGPPPLRLVPAAPAPGASPPAPVAAVPATVATAQPTFDVAALMENLGNEKSMLGEVVRLCRDGDAPRLLKELAGALAAGNCPAATKAAHGLKGMVGAFNATTAWAVAKRLETTAREGRLEILVMEADEFVRALRDLLTELEDFAGIEHQYLEWK
jgi:signal transduction histidine kinase/CheY-like chemotaxis protein